jgi:hypothetical protein
VLRLSDRCRFFHEVRATRLKIVIIGVPHVQLGAPTNETSQVLFDPIPLTGQVVEWNYVAIARPRN